MRMRRTWLWALCGAGILLALDGIGGVLVGITAAAPIWLALIALVGVLVVVGAALWLYRSVIMRRWARREPTELTGPRRVGHLLGGLGVGILFMLVAFGVAVALGAYRVHGFAHFTANEAVNLAALVLVSMFLEELIFRGVLLQAIEKGIGWRWALAITALLFGAIHLLNGISNAGVTLWAVLAIAIEAGFFLGAAFLWRRSLWLVIGIHGGWNLTESLLGIPVSSEAPDGLLQVTTHGGTLLSGGEFGIEASLIPVILGAALGVVFLVLRARRPALALAS
jgi:membrane protease YdiL (CAAX protease family)